MARKLYSIIAAATLALNAQTGRTQDSPPPPDPSHPVEDGGPRPPAPPGFIKRNPQDRPFRPGGEFDGARRVFEKLPPEDKQRIKQNLQQWKEMSPEERETMRLREQQRRQKMLRETEESILKSGLKLDADQRQVYALRYAQERRKIEEKLRKEMDEKRKPLIEEMIERLKTEFGAVPSPSASPGAKP